MAADRLVLDASLALHRPAITWHARAHDAIDLDLAARPSAPVATRDRGMAAAARGAGVVVC